MPSKPHAGVLPAASLVFASAMWGVIWFPLRILEQQGLPGPWITLICYAAALAGGVVLFRGHWEAWPPRPLALLTLAGAAGWANMGFILAVIEGPVVRVMLLFYLAPVWMVLLGRALLGERLSARALAVLVLAMTGALIMLWAPETGMPWPRGRADWLAVSAGFAFGLYNVLVRLLREIPVRAKTVASWAGVVLAAALALVSAGTPPPAVGVGPVLGAVALGFGGILFVTVAAQYGVTHLPVQRSAVLLLFQLVAGALSSLALTDEVVRPVEWMGGALILAAAYLSARRDAAAGKEAAGGKAR